MAGVDINRTSLGQSLPVPVVNQIITSARETSLVMRKAQRRTLVDGVAAIGATAGVTGSKFVAETARKPLGTATYSEKILRAYKIALVMSFSMEFMRDKRALYQALVSDMPKDLGATFDKAFFFGDGAPTGDFDTLAASPTVTLGGANPYTAFIAAINTSAGAGGNVTEFDIAPQGESGLFTLAADGRPLLVPSTTEGSVGRVLGRPVEISKNVFKDATPDTLGFAMDWDSVFWGMVEGIQYKEYDGPIYNGATLVHAGAQDNMGSVICEVEVAVRTINAGRHVRLTAAAA